jgi:adenylylsulfate kinase
MPSTLQRSFTKGIIWESISFILTLIAVYAIYGDFKASLNFALVLTIIKIFLFFIHERIWKMIKWGKYELPKRCLR